MRIALNTFWVAQRELIKRICLLLFFLLTACQPSAKPIDSFFEEGYGLEICHGVFFVGYTLKNPEQKQEAMAAIVHALRKPDCLKSEEISGWHMESGSGLSFRPRDYWALVLADISGQELTIYMQDSHETRDRKIKKLLEQIEEQAACPAG